MRAMISKRMLALLAVMSRRIMLVSAAQALSMQLSGLPDVNSAANMMVIATITNIGTENVKLLNDPNTPASRIPSDIFQTGPAGTPEFTGVQAKYQPQMAIAQSSITTLTPGQSMERTHDLAGMYKLSAPNSNNNWVLGISNITFRAVNDTDNSTYLIPASLTITRKNVPPVALSPVDQILNNTVNVANLMKRESFVGCDASRQAEIKRAAVAAQNYASGAFSYAKANEKSNTNRFRTWFGAYDAAKHQTILTQFTNINRNNFSAYTYDCTCTQNDVYAYVYPSRFGRVFLCGAFWQAPITGTDSKGGTLIHESSHFTDNAGTKDIAYGQKDCEALAIKNADDAVNNADSHEYFAENMPFMT
ncbi:deuterolysin M35 metalloprotease [Crassisporium funariophilum]|nr:deuterolysin M35 metalloprotease [Crassisporium funariophilum]